MEKVDTDIDGYNSHLFCEQKNYSYFYSPKVTLCKFRISFVYSIYVNLINLVGVRSEYFETGRFIDDQVQYKKFYLKLQIS